MSSAGMGAEQTLTAVQSPLSPGEQKDRAVLLVVGSAEAPALPARVRLQIAGDDLFVGRRGDGAARRRPTPPCWTTGWSRASTRASRAAPAAGTWKTWAARTAPGSTTRASRRRSRLRDGALLFIGNHVAVFRLVSAIELDAMKAELVSPFGPVRDRLARAGRGLRSPAPAGRARKASC